MLFIAVDDLRDWVGYSGRNPQTKTPNIDRLAARGVAFTRSYCAAPVCNPSRAALMSGLRPSTSGIYENREDWRKVISEDLPLTAAFRKAGYFVCGAGKIYQESFTRRSDWDDYLIPRRKDPSPPARSRNGVGAIKFAGVDCRDEDLEDWKITNYGINQLAREHDKPFFVAVGLHKPHLPWYVPKKYYDMFPLDSIELPPHIGNDLEDVPREGLKLAGRSGDHKHILKADKWKQAVRGYLAAIAYTDWNIGRLLDAYDRSPERDNTIICLWSDHGWHLGEKEHWRKYALWEEGTRAPLLWVVPGVTKPQGVCVRTVDFMSIYPTLTDLCGIPTPQHVEGASIRELLTDPAAPWDKPALTTYKFGNHAVRSEEWRYIRYHRGGEELYNAVEDPNEWINRAGDAELASTKAHLARFLPTVNTRARRAGTTHH